MKYKVRAYETQAAGKSGRFSPSDQFQSGSHTTAEHGAKWFAEEYGAAVLENTETGERTWFGR